MWLNDFAAQGGLDSDDTRLGALQNKPKQTVVVQITPKALRPDAAAVYLGVSPFRIEEWMREGLLEYVIPPGTDTRVIPVAVLDKFLASLPRQKGTLEGKVGIPMKSISIPL
jgi:hypothetical protein